MSEARCRECVARREGLCSRFDCDAAEQFAALSHMTSYRSGEEILGQGEPTGRIGVVASGLVKVVMLTEEGDEFLVQLLRPGQLVGVPGRKDNLFSWATATDAEICWVSRPAWDRFFDERPQHFNAYLTAMLDQLEELRLSVVKMRGRNTLQRLAFWILEQVPKATGADHPKVRILLTRRDLASLLDMTVETLSRSFHQLKGRKAIRLLAHDLIEVSDIERLRRLAKCNDETVGLPRAAPEDQGDAGHRSDWNAHLDLSPDPSRMS